MCGVCLLCVNVYVIVWKAVCECNLCNVRVCKAVCECGGIIVCKAVCECVQC